MENVNYDKYYPLEDFCRKTGFEKGFVRWVIDNNGDFPCLITETEILIPKEEEYEIRSQLQRIARNLNL